MLKILCLSFLWVGLAYSSEVDKLAPIEVTSPQDSLLINAEEASLTRVSSDTASLLETVPGVSLKAAGGLSSLPVIHGMADDRVHIKIDGATITSSCSNHMNPALSYVDPSKISLIEVLAGIPPVSQGGDSIGGSVIVKSKKLVFATLEERFKQALKLRTYFKSNNENQGASLSYSMATPTFYLGYTGLDDKANNYRTGSGKRLKSTLYAQNNQTLTLGKKLQEGELSLKLTRAVVPYEGFINQYMDLKDNVSNLANLSYSGLIGEAFVESTLFYQRTKHYMNTLTSERSGEMPMKTRSDEGGYNVKATFDLSDEQALTFGSDFNRYRLNDWWPAVPGLTSIMGPNTFQSIRDGKRDRLGFFVETQTSWTREFSTNLGLRTDLVSMDAGKVHGYNSTDNLPADANAFNSRSQAKNDHNLDATVLSKLKASPQFDLELGLARKTRSPNLYERYAWAGAVTDPADTSVMSGAGMDMMMVNWFGDGNGYVGDINLRPEVAHKISASFIAHDEASKEWEVKLTPYYSEIKNYIDADFLGSAMGNNFLKFANHDAVIFGADFSARSRFLRHKSLGDFTLRTQASYVRGYRKDGEADLYHLMPLNGKIDLEHRLGRWTSDVRVHLVNEKKQVNELRLEPATGRYALLDLGTSYQLSTLAKIDFSILNVFDLNYGLPLGGVDLVNYTPASKTTVAGMGRSFNTALTLDFF